MVSKVDNPQFNRPQKVYDKYQHVPKEYMEVAQGMETQFIHHMLEELNKTVEKTEPESGATQYYRSLQNYERAKIMADSHNGLGVKDMVLQQIYPQFNKNLNRDVGYKQDVSIETSNSNRGEKL